MDQQRYEHALVELHAKVADLGWRLALAQKFGALMTKAYDALQSYGIDYRKLRTYALWDSLVPVGITFDNPAAQSKLMEWVTRCGHDIDAAIRRKTNIKLTIDQKADPENGI